VDLVSFRVSLPGAVMPLARKICALLWLETTRSVAVCTPLLWPVPDSYVPTALVPLLKNLLKRGDPKVRSQVQASFCLSSPGDSPFPLPKMLPK